MNQLFPHLPSSIFHLPSMTQEGLFFLGVVLGMLLHAVIKVFIGLIKMAFLAL